MLDLQRLGATCHQPIRPEAALDAQTSVVICEQILKSLLVLVVRLSVIFAACRFLKSQPPSSREGPLLKRSGRVGSYSEALRYPAQ